MKKFVQMLLVVCMMVFGAQAAFANTDNVTVQEGADLTSIKRIAVAAPLYTPVDDKAPSKDMLTQIVSDASRVARGYVISYDAVVEGIKNSMNVDIKALDRRQSAKIYKENVANYADAYVVVTVANNSRTTFFFDVFKVGTNELLYTYEIRANKSEGDTVNTYNNMCEQFYKHFDRSVDDQVKAINKKK